MARQLNMELVMLYLKDGKVTTMKLSKHRLAAAHANEGSCRVEDAPSTIDDSAVEAFELISAPQHVLNPLSTGPQAVKC